MSLTVEAASVRVADDLENAERAANESLRAKARLLESMMITRLEADLPQYEGQIAVIRLQQAIANDVAAMGDLAKAHKSLRSDFIKITMIPDMPGVCPTGGLKPQEVAKSA